MDANGSIREGNAGVAKGDGGGFGSIREESSIGVGLFSKEEGFGLRV